MSVALAGPQDKPFPYISVKFHEKPIYEIVEIERASEVAAEAAAEGAAAASGTLGILQWAEK